MSTLPFVKPRILSHSHFLRRLLLRDLWIRCLGLLLLTGCAVNAAEGPYQLERKQFKEAREALAAGDNQRYRKLAAKLVDYPIYRYLAYERLRSEFLDKPTAASINRLDGFLEEFGDRALSRKLTSALQRGLVARKKWDLFLVVSQSPNAAGMSCARVRAQHELGLLHNFDDDSKALWIKVRKRPQLCKQALAALELRSSPGVAALWNRIFSAVEKNQSKVAKRLSAQLATKDRKQVQRWVAALEKPQQFLDSRRLDQDNLLNRTIIRDLIWRWSKDELEPAIKRWQRIKNLYAFKQDDRYTLTRRLALRSAYRRMPEANQWLNSFTARKDDLELQEWRVRAALLAQDWSGVLKLIGQLPANEQEEDHWAYWVARALEQTGDADVAEKIYLELAELQSYHGFLAADRVGKPYNIYDEPLDVEDALVTSLEQHATLLRAREYHHTGLPWEARREWNTALKSFSALEIKASAVVADRWQLPDRAIISAGRAEARRALSYRFPLLFEEQVAKAAIDQALEPNVILGVMRRESGFVPDIKSGAGAVGLMQLMPNTAKYVAGLKGKKNWRGDLTDAGVNIDFGAFYLRHVLNKFDNHLPLALASYNAGPHRVKKWLPTADLPADVWIDTIPFSETRRYVRAVLAYSLIFEWRKSGGAVTKLEDRLVTVGAG